MSSFSRRLTLRRLAITILYILTAPALPLAAQSLTDSVQVHGFGGWAYAETDGNEYLIGVPDGSWDNGDFALNITARPMDKLSIVAQIRGEAVNGDDNFELDYAFAGWSITDELELRIGRVKHPFGIYGEIFDVGTLRPLFHLSQAVYGPGCLTARAYNGVGIAGHHEWDSGWGLEADLYYGQIEGDFRPLGLQTGVPEYIFVPHLDREFQVNDAIGGRLTVNTPVTGLSFGVSAYTGDDYTELESIVPGTRRDVYLGSFSFVNGRWLARAEWARLSRQPDVEYDSWYLEGGFKITHRWQLAARYDGVDADLNVDLEAPLPFFSQFLEHRALEVGVNYWFGASLVIRLSYSQVKGNLYAFLSTPEEIMELMATGELDDKTDMVLVGAQFSF